MGSLVKAHNAANTLSSFDMSSSGTISTIPENTYLSPLTNDKIDNYLRKLNGLVEKNEVILKK